MKIQQATLATCSEATGTVVAIDVIRAFTTAAFAFAAGAQDILLVGEVQEALALRQRFPLRDMECCLDMDRFDFAMVVERRDGLLVMQAA